MAGDNAAGNGRLGAVAAYAAAVVAFGDAAMSLYWAVGGRGLISTVGGLLALALVRPWGLAFPRRWLLNVLAGALVLAGASCWRWPGVPTGAGRQWPMNPCGPRGERRG
jgi:hypothetical protein